MFDQRLSINTIEHVQRENFARPDLPRPSQKPAEEETGLQGLEISFNKDGLGNSEGDANLSASQVKRQRSRSRSRSAEKITEKESIQTYTAPLCIQQPVDGQTPEPLAADKKDDSQKPPQMSKEDKIQMLKQRYQKRQVSPVD